ncbi:MAG: tripartite tricarboxylate transporter substrate-binding protein [Desulfobacterales bacterium]|nr:tripartite tricarboxylate transporter substrate-binding protein [Desulfobacterales bacterium]
MNTKRCLRWLGLVLVAGGLVFNGAAQAAYPDKPVEFIAPANPGGGWDLTCRMSSQVLKEAGLVAQPMVVANKPGGFGVVAMTEMTRSRAQDQNTLVAFSAVLTTQMAIKKNPFTYKDVTPVAALFVDYGAIAVKKDAKYASFKDLIEDWKKQPGGVSFAGSSPPGGLDHMRIAMMAKELGLPLKDLRYVAFQGGADALAALLGGHVTAFVGEAGEIAGHAESGTIRPLALLSDRKLTGIFEKVPMASEFGVKVSSANWRGFYGAPGMKKEVLTYWEETLGKMVKTKQWADVLEKQAWVNLFLTGEKLQTFLDDELTMYQNLAKELGLVQ